jgi:hypothetical protein
VIMGVGCGQEARLVVVVFVCVMESTDFAIRCCGDERSRWVNLVDLAPGVDLLGMSAGHHE